MDSKREVRVGDFVMYDDGRIVSNDDGVPLRVVEIKQYYTNMCVFYINGEFDYLNNVYPASELLLELIWFLIRVIEFFV